MNCARNYENVLNFVRVMPKILLVPFFRTRCSFCRAMLVVRSEVLLSYFYSSVCPSVTLVICGHTVWVRSKVITQIIMVVLCVTENDHYDLSSFSKYFFGRLCADILETLPHDV